MNLKPSKKPLAAILAALAGLLASIILAAPAMAADPRAGLWELSRNVFIDANRPCGNAPIPAPFPSVSDEARVRTVVEKLDALALRSRDGGIRRNRLVFAAVIDPCPSRQLEDGSAVNGGYYILIDTRMQVNLRVSFALEAWMRKGKVSTRLLESLEAMLALDSELPALGEKVGPVLEEITARLGAK